MYKIIKNEVDFLIWRDGMGHTAEIYDIAVMSERRKGIGTQMVNEMIKEAKKEGVKRVFAITRDINKGAQIFYEKNGFEANLLKNFYPDGDAYMYIKSI